MVLTSKRFFVNVKSVYYPQVHGILADSCSFAFLLKPGKHPHFRGYKINRTYLLTHYFIRKAT